MNYLEIQGIIEDIEKFTESVKKKHGLDIAVSILSGDRLYDVNKFADVLGYLRKNKKKVVKTITLYDIDFATSAAIQHTKVKSIREVTSRHRPNIYYRQIFCYIARSYGFSFKKIGNYIIKDHATVIHATRQIEDLLEIRDTDIVRIYNRVYANLELLLNPYITENEQTLSITQPISDISE